MGRSRTYKYQVGRFYIIDGVDYMVQFASTNKGSALRQALKFIKAKVRKDFGRYAVLVPTSNVSNTSVLNLSNDYKINRKKVGLRF